MAPRPTSVSPREPSSGHIAQLDGLRGLAILIVLIYHFAGDIPFNVILIAPVYYGWSGVDLFFVLSGFLITRILLRTREDGDYFRSFYIRRALRIFPLYYGVLALCALVSFGFPALRSMFPSAHDQLFHWLYLSNWTPLLHLEDQRRMGGFWSLAIEEQFYWMWPVLVWKFRPSRLPFAAAGGIAAAVLLRVCLYGHATDPFVYRNTFCRMDALMAGALCALAWRSPAFQSWFRRRRRLVPAAIIVLLALAMAGGARWHDQFTYRIGFTVFDTAYALLLLYVLQCAGVALDFFNSRIMRNLGKYSYGIYVYHQFIYGGFAQMGVAPGLPLLTASLAGTLALSVASYELMEKRFIDLKSRFSGKPARRIRAAYSPEESAVAL